MQKTDIEFLRFWSELGIKYQSDEKFRNKLLRELNTIIKANENGTKNKLE